MNDWFKIFAEWCAKGIEVIGITIITVAALIAVGRAIVEVFRKTAVPDLVHTVRQGLGRGILLGLEFLVAADIIHTVAVELTLRSVATLAIIVVIRTFLSFALEVELDGRWPWKQGPDGAA